MSFETDLTVGFSLPIRTVAIKKRRDLHNVFDEFICKAINVCLEISLVDNGLTYVVLSINRATKLQKMKMLFHFE